MLHGFHIPDFLVYEKLTAGQKITTSSLLYMSLFLSNIKSQWQCEQIIEMCCTGCVLKLILQPCDFAFTSAVTPWANFYYSPRVAHILQVNMVNENCRSVGLSSLLNN